MYIQLGTCKACACKDSEIEFLRALIRPKPEVNQNYLPTVTLEADAIMSGNDVQLEINRDDQVRQSDVDDEAARILSGQY